MKSSLLTLSIAAIFATAAGPALAQAVAQKASSPEPVRPQAVAAAAAPKALAVAGATGRAPVLTMITAAGSVIVLADGIVANVSTAQIQPPAPGFVYEY